MRWIKGPWSAYPHPPPIDFRKRHSFLSIRSFSYSFFFFFPAPSRTFSHVLPHRFNFLYLGSVPWLCASSLSRFYFPWFLWLLPLARGDTLSEIGMPDLCSTPRQAESRIKRLERGTRRVECITRRVECITRRVGCITRRVECITRRSETITRQAAGSTDLWTSTRARTSLTRRESESLALVPPLRPGTDLFP